MSLILIILLIGSTAIYGLILLYLAGGLNHLKKQKRNKSLPHISVIVCAHNEQHNLPDCIHLLQNQIYPEDKIEFILMNDRSDDNTESIMQDICRNDQRFITFSITDRVEGFAPKKRAIDYAIHQSRPESEIILLTDADGRPGPEWAKEMISFFSPETDMVLGYAPYQIKPKNHFAKQILALEYLSHAAIAAATSGLNFPATCVGTNMAYRKKMYLKIGGFGPFKNQISGDDDLFLTYVRDQKKYKIAYATGKKTHVYNNPPRLWSKFIHQRMRYASKGFKYPVNVTLALITYFLFNVQFFILSLSFIYSLKFFWIYLSVVGFKWLFEFLFMFKAGRLLEDLRHFKIFVFAAMMHVPYVVIFAILGQFDYFKWAEDTAESGVVQGVEQT